MDNVYEAKFRKWGDRDRYRRKIDRTRLDV